MLIRLIDWIFEQFQKRCPHDPQYVSGDMLEGSGGANLVIKWCQRCGAYQIHHPINKTRSEMREPRATWVERLDPPMTWKEWEASKPESW